MEIPEEFCVRYENKNEDWKINVKITCGRTITVQTCTEKERPGYATQSVNAVTERGQITAGGLNKVVSFEIWNKEEYCKI